MGILNEEAIRVATDRYFTTEEKAIAVQYPDAAFRAACLRVARAVAHAEQPEQRANFMDQFFDAIYSQSFVPGGRFWANAGAPNQQFPNCFVDSPEDSKESIFKVLTDWALIHSGGGGTGADFSQLRSRGMKTSRSRGVSSGPVTFIKLYDAEADTIVQGGSRRAACMATLRVDHPDILEFILLKDRTQKVRRFNISVAATDVFMSQVFSPDAEAAWKVYDPYSKEHYYIWIPMSDELPQPHSESYDRVEGIRKNYLQRELISIESVEPINFVGRDGFFVSPLDIWTLIVDNAWTCGDPGLFFVDEVNRKNPLIPHSEDITNRWYIRTTNPCGEIPMANLEICMLGSINLSKFVRVLDDGRLFMDWDGLATTTKLATRFLDDAIDVATFPLTDQADAAKSTRRIGLGILGWADMLIKMKITYGSLQSLDLARQVMKFINEVSLNTSVELGAEKGNFSLFEQSAYFNGVNGFPQVPSLRNAFRTNIPPTGTTSILAMVSSSGEPLFQREYVRKDETGERVVRHPLYQEYLDANPTVPGAPGYFIIANEVLPDLHVKMQAAFQEHVDNAISKTINLPENATREDIAAAYRLAWELKCKGVTVYRDKSKETQVLNHLVDGEPAQSPSVGSVYKGLPTAEIHQRIDRMINVVGGIQRLQAGSRERREEELPGSTCKIPAGEGTLYVTVNNNGDGLPYELFATIGKGGTDTMAFTEAIGRLVSLALQYRIPAHQISHQLIGIAGSKVTFFKIGKYKRVLSVPDAIGKVLVTQYENAQNRLQQQTDAVVRLSPVPTGVTELKQEASFVGAPTMTVVSESEDICSICETVYQHREGCKVCLCGSVCEE